MEKRTPASTKPAASATARTADAKRLAERDANVAKTARPSALSTRATGNTISKPPTRPIASARKTSGRDVDDAASTRSNDSSTRSSRLSTVGTNARTTRPPEPMTDKTRRTTVGGSATPVPPKRPSTTSRASVASPSTDRARATQTSTATRPPTSNTAKPPRSPASVSTKSAASSNRPISRDAIPEEPENLADIPSISSQMGSEAKHPVKLEIRSMNSSTPALKPQALSDNEGRPRFVPRHSRTQSAVLPNRPMTAPMPPMNEQQQSMREMEVLSNLLRESTRRDTMATEIADLKSEISKLELQNKTLTEAAAKSPVIKPQAIVEATEKKERELKVILRSQHLQEIESIKASHKTALDSRESHHAKELETLRSELDSQRQASSHLVGVETRIEAVESALRDSKQRASQSEQELQQKIQKKDEDKDKLGTVISDLRQEIERCQLKLNQDVAKQSKEKREAQKAQESLKKELDAERERLEQLVKEKVGEGQRVKLAVEEARKAVEPDMERLRNALAKAEKASTKLREELESMRKGHEAALEKEKQALTESAKTVTQLEADLTKQKEERTALLAEQKSRGEADKKVTADLRSELEELQRLHEEELQEFETSRREHDEITSSLREKLAKLQQDGVDGSQVVEDLQEQLREFRDSNIESEGRGSAATSELEKLRSVVERLERESAVMKKSSEEAQVAKDDESNRVKELEEVGKKARKSAERLQEQLEAATRSKEEASEQLHNLQESVEGFREELESVRAQTSDDLAEKQKQIEQLTSDLEISRKETEQATSELETAKITTNSTEEERARLEQEVERLQQQLVVEQEIKLEAKHKAEALLIELQELRGEFESLRSESEQSHHSVEREQTRAEELARSLADAEEARSNAASSLGSLQSEMQALQEMLDGLKGEVVKKEAEHVKAMGVQKREHDEVLASLREKHGEETARRTEDDAAAVEKDVAHVRALEALKTIHEKQIEEMLGKHKIMTYDTTEKHAAGEKVWQEKLDAVEAEKDALARTLAELASVDEGPEAELERERQVNRNLREMLQQLEAQSTVQTTYHQSAIQSLQAQLGAMKTEHQAALENLSRSLSNQHEDSVQAVMDRHAQQIAEIEEEASRRAEESGRERDRVHEMQLARLEAEHAEMLREAMHAPLANERVMSGEEEEEEDMGVPETPGGKGLSHIFVNRDAVSPAAHAADIPDGRETESMPQLAETPLAYASEEEKEYSFVASPTPGAEKPRKAAGGHLQATQRPRRHDLEKRNAELEALLEKSRAELAELKERQDAAVDPNGDDHQHQQRGMQRSRLPSAEISPLPPTTPSRLKTPQHASPLSSHSHTRTQPPSHDPFTTITSPPSIMFSPRNSTILSPSSPSKWTEAPMTLEGTLESIRVQTEQLLEINEDFLSEGRRWGARRSMGGERRRRRVGVGGS